MKRPDLLSQIALGEDSTRQFKADVKNADSLASEMAAFANTKGGTIFIGVADDGSTPGLSGHDVARINQLISNAASHLVRSPLVVQTENVGLENGHIVIVLTVPKGIDKPYFDKNGVIWLKAGADKRRVNSKEELRRLFQFTHQFHADELPTKAGIDKLDKLRFRDFLRDVYKQEYPASASELTRLLQNMNLATAVDLLETLKAEKLKVNHWRDKEATRDAVRLTIQDYLWSEKTGLPETYSEAEVREKSEAIFVHVFRAYPTVPSPCYASMAS